MHVDGEYIRAIRRCFAVRKKGALCRARLQSMVSIAPRRLLETIKTPNDYGRASVLLRAHGDHNFGHRIIPPVLGGFCLRQVAKPASRGVKVPDTHRTYFPRAVVRAPHISARSVSGETTSTSAPCLSTSITSSRESRYGIFSSYRPSVRN